MSQKGSSINSDNPEFKYKKALQEIQKIHNANKVLKNQSEEMKNEYQRQIADLTHSLNQLEKEYDALKHEKADIEKYYDQLQLSQNELRKEYNNLEREVTYLNEVLTEQNTQLKKISAFKDEKGLSILISSYEDKEMNYRKDISRLEEINKNLKSTYETLDNDLSEERRQRFKLEDLNNSLRMEITKYRELNNILLSKNQNIVATLLSRTTQGKEKYRQAEGMLSELSKQLEMVKATRIEQQSTNKNTIALESYEAVLHEKGKAENQIMKLREKIEQLQDRVKEAFEMEEKMKRAELRTQQLHEECNMLKGKLILIETKDAMDNEGDFTDLKQLEQRILSSTGPNDPLVAIKNSSDSSHFQLMKSYIIDLKEKLSKALLTKKEVDKKYRSLKEKLTQKAQKSISFEEQNKLLKGKLEGYERLTERLQYELQKSIEVHDEEITKIKTVTNNIVAKKTEEVKVTNAYVRAQLDLQLDKFEKTQKGLRQELETLKLELSTQKIKNADLQEKNNEANEFLAIYQKKISQITASNEEAEEHNQMLEENATKFEQLYREERSNNEALLAQKQALTNRLTETSEELDRKRAIEEDLKEKCLSFEGEAKKAKTELLQAKGEIEGLQNILKVNKKELEDKSRGASMDISRSQSSYYTALENNFNIEREKSRELEAEVQSLKLRLERALIASQKVPHLEDELNSKADELNDFKRKAILTEKQISIQEAEIKEIRNEFDILRRQNNALKAKVMEGGQQLRRSFQFKDIESKKSMQKLNEQLSSALSELREERRLNARMQTDIQNYRSELQRLTNFIEQSKSKEQSMYEEASQLRNNFEVVVDENDRLKSQMKYKNGLIEGLNNDISNAQERFAKLSQENSEVRMRKEEIDNDLADLKRQITGLKIYLNEIEEYAQSKVASGGWQEQRDRENISNFVQRVKKILKKTEAAAQSGQYRSLFAGTSSPAPDYLRNYNEPLYGFAPKVQTSYQQSPQNQNYGVVGSPFKEGQMTFKYGDYN